MKRLRILLSAHELSPSQGSECAEGWNLVTRLAQYHDITVLYARGSQFAPNAYETAIKKFYSENTNEYNIEFIAIPQPRLTLLVAAINKRISKTGSSIGIPFLYYFGYRQWQKEAYKTASLLLKSSSFAPGSSPGQAFRLSLFALVHHLTSINFREPGYLWKLGVPFIWGPTGGTAKLPLKFASDLGFRTQLSENLRNLVNAIALRFKKRITEAIKRSSLIYTFSQEDLELFKLKGAKSVELMLDAGCQSPNLAVLQSDSLTVSQSHRLKILWVGQLIRRKALDILLNAVSGDPELEERVEITIVGNGPLRSRYQQQISRLGLTNTTITGWLSHEEVFNHMISSDVLVHTSYREATSNVIPEALSCGLPVICHDICGMAIAVTDQCGIKVPLESHEKSVTGFRQALRIFIAPQPATGNRHPATFLREGALARATELSWDHMANRIALDYARIANQS